MLVKFYILKFFYEIEAVINVNGHLNMFEAKPGLFITLLFRIIQERKFVDVLWF